LIHTEEVELKIATFIRKHLQAPGNKENPVLLFLFGKNLVPLAAADSVQRRVRGPSNGISVFLAGREQNDQGRAESEPCQKKRDGSRKIVFNASWSFIQHNDSPTSQET
jgi:hypothetical protein